MPQRCKRQRRCRIYLTHGDSGHPSCADSREERVGGRESCEESLALSQRAFKKECVVRALRVACAIATGLQEGVCRASVAGCLRYRNGPSRRSVSCERCGLLALSQRAFKKECRASVAGCLRYRNGPSRRSVSCERCGLLALSQRAFKKECVVRALRVACAIATGLQERGASASSGAPPDVCSSCGLRCCRCHHSSPCR